MSEGGREDRERNKEARGKIEGEMKMWEDGRGENYEILKMQFMNLGECKKEAKLYYLTLHVAAFILIRTYTGNTKSV